MKRIWAIAFLAGLLVCAGCFTTAPPKVLDLERPEPLAVEPKAPPLTPDQVTAKNAHECWQKLADEIDRDMKTAGSRQQATGSK